MRLLLLLIPALLFAASPAEMKIAQAKREIAAHPDRAENYDALAMALARRARETSDVKYYELADEALQKCFALDPNNFGGLKTNAWVLLGRHEFAKALEAARKLNQKVPDDVQVYGFLTDANIELGNYEAAEKAAQWMLDLRPGNVPGLTRGAYLRELFGDIDGAIDFMKQAYSRTRPEETEDRAWIATQVGHLLLVKGDIPNAERALANALRLYPDYHYALANLGKLRWSQKNFEAAVELFRKRYENARHPENLYDLAVALHKAGKLDEAQTAFTEFEAAARKEMNLADNSNRELIFYFLDYANKREEGLKLARRELGIRRDVYALHAAAWAMYKNGQTSEARKLIDGALKVGVRDPDILAHAKEMRGEMAAAVR